jgi:glycine oxidase
MIPDVAIVGGGAIGLSIALRCAADGRAVTVFDPSPGEGASGVAAGMLAPITELHYGEDDLLRLNRVSATMFGDWVAAIEESTGLPTGYRSTGTLMVARDADENAYLHEIHAHQSSLDLKVERLRGSEARRLEPALAANVRGAILVPDDHQVDAAALVDALLVACRQAKVEFVPARVERVVSSDNRVTGVSCDGEVTACETVVISAGCWSARIEGVPAPLPIRPVKGQLIELAGTGGPPLLERNVRGPDVYLVPRADGRLIIGATVEEMGFDDSVTAGAALSLLRDAYEIVPGIAEMRLVRTRAGLRPGTPDNGPLLGPVGLEGLIVATGHFRNGILLAPVTASIVAEVIETGALPEIAAPFSAGRFG